MRKGKTGLQRLEQNQIQMEYPAPLDAVALNQTTGDEADTEISEYLALLWRRKWLMLCITVLVLTAGMLYTLTRQSIYESEAKIVVGNRSRTSFSEADVPLISDLQALTRSRSVDTQVEIIRSPDILDDAYRRLDPKMRSEGFQSEGIPDWSYRISTKNDTDVIAVTGRAYTPDAAAALANTIADTYLKYDLRQSNRATQRARSYIEGKLAKAEEDLTKASAQLAHYKQQTHFFAPDVQLTKAAEQAAQLTLDLGAAKAQAASIEREVSTLRREMTSEQREVVANTTVTPNPHFDDIVENISKLETERATLLQEYTPGSIEVRQIDERIKHERERLKKITATTISSKVHARNPIREELLTRYLSGEASLAATKGRITAIKTELAAHSGASSSLPERERKYTQLAQRVVMLQRTYDMLSTKYYALVLNEQATVPTGMLASSARLPGSPSYPRVKKNFILFGMLGVLLATVIAVFLGKMDRRLHDYDAVESVSGLSTLSMVPKNPEESLYLLPGKFTDGPLVESYRILRNNLSFSMGDRQLKVIAVTSPGRGEGKSTTTVNLAAAMAMEGKLVLIVDCDLRQPSLHKIFHLSNSTGLSSVLNGTARLEDAISGTKNKKVFCLPSGPPPVNPAEILNSKPCRALFQVLTQHYDVVLVDSPPAAGLSDVQVISTLADGVLLVVSMHQTLKPHLELTLRSLALAEAPLIGTVINRTDARYAYSGYYYYNQQAND